MASSCCALVPITQQERWITTERPVSRAIFSKKHLIARFEAVKPCEPSVRGGWAAIKTGAAAHEPDWNITQADKVKPHRHPSGKSYRDHRLRDVAIKAVPLRCGVNDLVDVGLRNVISLPGRPRLGLRRLQKYWITSAYYGDLCHSSASTAMQWIFATSLSLINAPRVSKPRKSFEPVRTTWRLYF